MSKEIENFNTLFPDGSVADYIQVKSNKNGLTLTVDLGLHITEAGDRLQKVSELETRDSQFYLFEIDGPASLPWQNYTKTFLNFLLVKNVRYIAVPPKQLDSVRGRLSGIVMDSLQSLSPVSILSCDVPLRHVVNTSPLTSRIHCLSSCLDPQEELISSMLSTFQQSKFVPKSLRSLICNLGKLVKKNTKMDKMKARMRKSALLDETLPLKMNQPKDDSPTEGNKLDYLDETDFDPTETMSAADDNSSTEEESELKSSGDIDFVSPKVGSSKYDQPDDIPELKKCYVCKKRFDISIKSRPKTKATEQYPRMCSPCANLNLKMRNMTVDLSGYYALVTGGRVKIGYETVLKLLRNGCHVITTTRFPHDAVKRYSAECDFEVWSHHLKIYPLDLKDAKGIFRFIGFLKKTLPHLDILVNNAAQTLHRPYTFYEHLVEYEQLPLQSPNQKERIAVNATNCLTYSDRSNRLMTTISGSSLRDQSLPVCTDPTLGYTKRKHLFQSFCPEQGLAKRAKLDHSLAEHTEIKTARFDPSYSTHLEKTGACKYEPSCDIGESKESENLPSCSTECQNQNRDNISQNEEIVRNLVTEDFPTECFDEFGQQLDLRSSNSWRLVLEEVPVSELVEVMMINTIAPYILNKELKELMLKSPHKRRYIVNVSAMEGQFNRTSKNRFHPHTNMAKAALNMMTRTGALGYHDDGIFMTSVDTGWVTDERPFSQAAYEADSGFVLPLDCVDGAARILHPVFAGESSKEEPPYAVFLKNYLPFPW